MQRDLVERARSGDHEAFEALTAAAFDRLYAVAWRILRDRDRCDDAVQECLIKAWRDLRGLRDADRFDAWLFRLLVNACRDEGRRERRRGSGDRACCSSTSPGGIDAIGSVADRDELERGFRRLTHRPTDRAGPAPLPRDAPVGGRRDRSASRSGPSIHGSITRPRRCVPFSRRTRGQSMVATGGRTA